MTVTILAQSPGQVLNTPAGTFTADANSMIYGVLPGLAMQSLVDAGGVPLAFSPVATYRDILDAGDFTIAPWQRNIPGLASGGVIATAITNTPTYFADRWVHWGASTSSIKPATVADTTISGYNNALKVQRTAANTDTNAIYTAQIVESADCIRCQGHYLTLSLLVKAGANFSGAGLSAAIIGSTGSNQSSASLAAGTWTNQATLISTVFSLIPGYQKLTLVTSAPVPAAVTQLAVQLSYIPSGTAGTDDSFSLLDTQLELGQIYNPIFERRDAQVELEISQRYAAVFAEPASGVFVASGNLTTTTNASVILPLPVQMWRAPVLSGLGAVSKGSLAIAAAGATLTTSALAGNATHTTLVIGLSATVAAGTAGQGCTLQGGGGSGYIVASADF